MNYSQWSRDVRITGNDSIVSFGRPAQHPPAEEDIEPVEMSRNGDRSFMLDTSINSVSINVQRKFICHTCIY